MVEKESSRWRLVSSGCISNIAANIFLVGDGWLNNVALTIEIDANHELRQYFLMGGDCVN